jgi:hypothetical protein
LDADQTLVSRSQVEQTQAQASTDEASVASAQSNVVAQQANARRMRPDPEPGPTAW